MYLGTLNLLNFRSCEATTVVFDRALTVLVGENASGKSAVVDALRLCTVPASGRQSAWFDADRDLTRGVAIGQPVELEARFTDLSDAEAAVYLAQVVEEHGELVYRASFATDPGVPRRSVLSWGVGDARVEDPEPANRRRITHVYMPPLRDAVRDIDGGTGNQLHDVIRILLAGDRESAESFVVEANEALQAIAEHPVAQMTQATIQDYFGQSTPPDREHRVELNRRQVELRRIARLLHLQLAEAGIPVGDIASTGLGYANLLYIAMVVLELVKARDSDLTLLLVEEPEAHLHPQLQLVLLEFLREQARRSGSDNAGLSPAGRVQVIVTSHSPNLASAVSIMNVVAVARAATEATIDEEFELGTVEAWRTQTTAFSTLQLPDAAVRKIDRYLSVTRAALLFARQVILVEGTAEMVLTTALARRHLASASDPPDAEQGQAAARLRQFHNVSLISVEGVDFQPFLTLLLTGPHPRVDRVVVVTDGDNGKGQRRKEAYETAFSDAAGHGRLRICVGESTLEAELFAEPGNEEILKDAYLELHPRSSENWTKVATAGSGLEAAGRAAIFAEAIRKKSKNDEETENPLSLDISKGDFAHLVAEAIAERDSDRDFVVPTYLTEAIDAVTAAPEAHVEKSTEEGSLAREQQASQEGG